MVRGIDPPPKVLIFIPNPERNPQPPSVENEVANQKV
jgi:hypothetical protein